jgi:hypothetical protein
VRRNRLCLRRRIRRSLAVTGLFISFASLLLLLAEQDRGTSVAIERAVVVALTGQPCTFPKQFANPLSRFK